MNRCRTCLGSDKEMRHVHTKISISGESVSLSDILLNFYSYKLTESALPENICINCVHQLILTYSFKILIESSAKTLAESNVLNSTNEHFEGSLEPDDDYDVQKHHKKKKLLKIRKPTGNSECQSNNLYCVECKMMFNSAKVLHDHCLKNHPVKNVIGRECEYCNEKFEDFRSLVQHRKLHLKPYLCENCWDGFYNVEDLQTHFCQPNIKNKDNNKPDKNLRQCDQCGKSYPPSYIRIHMLTHSNDRPYSCKYCPKRFKVPGGLHSHILWNHKRVRNHKCEVCNATFISSSSRSSHIRKSHLKEKKYSCESCGKRFFSKSELQRHSLTHTGVKNFHCHLCVKSYQTRYGLNVHLKSHTVCSV
ncbi:Zinc finger protein 26 [Papilio xuthus]|uniref:Zinc finger protein 26 n=1 Tax=Papilio xuthus TaxID=66420 RepID=A0A194PI04_PAPXU|nr:Zinc finger protein 26 [Papilio xuthus]